MSQLPAELHVDLKLMLVSNEPIDGGVCVTYVADIMGVRKDLRVVCGTADLADVPARVERMLRAYLANALVQLTQPDSTKAKSQATQPDDEPPNYMGW